MKELCQMVSRFLKAFPYLKPVRTHSLFERFLKESNGNLLCVYNKSKDTYELHSLKSFKYNGESLNAVIPEDALNGWVIKDYRANDLKKYRQEVESDRMFTNKLLDNYENKEEVGKIENVISKKAKNILETAKLL